MKRFFPRHSLLLTLALSLSASAGEVLFAPERVSDWLWNYTPDKVSVSARNGVKTFRIRGYRQRVSARKFPVKNGIVYRLSGEFRAAPGSTPAKFYFGFAPCCGKGRPINSPTVNLIPGSGTALLADVGKTDRIIRLAPAANWKTGGFVVFHAEKDLSDLPNFHFSKGTVQSIARQGESMIVTLSRPVGLEAAKGTPVREHFPGGNYHYAGALNETAPLQWTLFEGYVSGFARGGLPRDQWWAGTETVAVMILGNYRGPEDAVLEFRNLKFETADREKKSK